MQRAAVAPHTKKSVARVVWWHDGPFAACWIVWCGCDIVRFCPALAFAKPCFSTPSHCSGHLPSRIPSMATLPGPSSRCAFAVQSSAAFALPDVGRTLPIACTPARVARLICATVDCRVTRLPQPAAGGQPSAVLTPPRYPRVNPQHDERAFPAHSRGQQRPRTSSPAAYQAVV